MNGFRKVYVDVLGYWRKDGKILPLKVIWEDGRRFAIDKVVDVRLAASTKAGGSGMRYTIQIGGRETFLFLDNSRWFVECKIQ